MWVARMTASQEKGGWQLTGAGKDLGTFQAAVIAHNGKCANSVSCCVSLDEPLETLCQPCWTDAPHKHTD